MTRSRFAAIIIGLGLLALGACTKSTDLISVEEGDPTCDTKTKSAVVVYKVKSKGGSAPYSFTVTSKVAGEGVVAKGSGTSPDSQTPVNELVAIDRKATVEFTDKAGMSMKFDIDPATVCK